MSYARTHARTALIHSRTYPSLLSTPGTGGGVEELIALIHAFLPPGTGGGVEDLIGLDVHALNYLKDNGFPISDDKVQLTATTAMQLKRS